MTSPRELLDKIVDLELHPSRVARALDIIAARDTEVIQSAKEEMRERAALYVFQFLTEFAGLEPFIASEYQIIFDKLIAELRALPLEKPSSHDASTEKLK